MAFSADLNNDREGWVVMTQSIDIESFNSTTTILNVLSQQHQQEKQRGILFVCSDESLTRSLNELIDECISSYNNNNSSLLNISNRNHISLTWNTSNNNNNSNESEEMNHHGDDDSERFTDGFNVWKERINMFCLRLLNRDFDSIMSQNEQIHHLIQIIIRQLLATSLVGSICAKNRALLLSISSELISRILSIYITEILQISCAFVDAADILVAKSQQSTTHHQPNYLCSLPTDVEFSVERQQLSQQIVQSTGSRLVIIQGNVLKDSSGNRCLFSTDPKFGVECSVATVAKMLQCQHAEFYVNAYGILTCQLPATSQPIDHARVVRTLNFVEALEIAASTTSEPKVISPLTLKQFQEHDIPVHVKSIHFDHSHPGTFISASNESELENDIPQIKSICLRLGIIIISIDTINMWQQVGFLSDIFALFKRYNLSVDYVTTSEANITCSLDTIAEDSESTVDRLDRIKLLLKDLESMNCRASTLGPCAAISLVGRNVRGLLHTLGPIFNIFNSTSAGTNHQIHLISQAHSNVNLSFIVPQIENVNILVTDVHNYLFGKDSKFTSAIGEEWSSLLPQQQAIAYRPRAVEVNAVSGKNVWWRRKASHLFDLMKREQQPLYVYDTETIRERALSLVDNFMKDSKSAVVNFIFYAIKANPHPEMLKVIESMHFGFECVSTSELNHVLSLFPNIDRRRILFTPNFAPKEEYEYGLGLGVNLTLDNTFPLEVWPELFQGKEIFLRVDPGIGKGHHAKVKTAGVNSKFGIPISDFPKLATLVDTAQATVVGLHAHLGSGILKEVKSWKETAQAFLDMLMQDSTSHMFRHVKTIDLGGGLGVPYSPEHQPLDLSQVYLHLHSLTYGNKKYADFIRQRDLKFWIEPGRFLSAESGILVARVTQTKKKDENNRYVGLETGMNSLIRPTLYNAYHEIVNLSGLHVQNDEQCEFPSSNDNPSIIKEKYTVVGPICESGDVLGEDRWLHKCENGHVVVIACSGAYGHSMSSFYNNREPAKEVFI